MKVLVVNNESRHAQELVVACRHNGRHDVTLINWHELPLTEIKKFEAVVLSGSSSYSLDYFGNSVYKFQKKLIHDGIIPIIGICIGFELICGAFGITL